MKNQKVSITIIEKVDDEIIDEYTTTFIDGIDYEINKESILSLQIKDIKKK